MSILIKGMEMPEHCGHCRFRYDGICHALQKTQYSMEECPIVPAADAIEELSKPKWIPVTERLPEMHDEVLICNDDYGKTGLGFATVAVWDGSDWVNAWDKEGTICCVTHWMPLPQPPKEE